MRKPGMSVAISAPLVTAGCPSIEKSDAIAAERELAAAGFQMKFAKTPGADGKDRITSAA